MSTQVSQAPVLEQSDLEKIRQQFDHLPYPGVPLDKSPKEQYDHLYTHNLITSYYLRHRRVVQPTGKVILDAGCGSGYKSLILAEANPGARIVGVDISAESVKLAEQRLQYHGFENCEFHAMPIEDLPSLGLKFDYINCDEVLYLLPDPIGGLRAMKSVLAADGVLRANLHNAHQRSEYYRAQRLFKLVGLMDESPKDFEYEVVRETMHSLKPGVRVRGTWGPMCDDPDYSQGSVFANHLLVGDKGFTIPELFAMLAEVDLEFVSMVNWRHWEIADLFNDADNLPAFWSMGLASASLAEKLHLYELFNPAHRLMDFWCAHPGQVGTPIEEWCDADWQQATVHLHPQICTERMRQELLDCVAEAQPLEISRDVPLPTMAPVRLESTVAACLLPLWEGPQSIAHLADRYRQIHPVHPVTLAPISSEMAFQEMRNLLNRLDAFLYVLLEP